MINLTTEIENRKTEHLQICLKENVEFKKVTNGLEKYRFTHCCLPELDRSDINIKTKFLGKFLGAPLLISSMTGGTQLAYLVNTRLATVAQHYRLAMGVGSQRIILEQPELAFTFTVRKLAPDILLFANLGAIQLNYGCGLEECKKLVDLIEADALMLHLNPLQELIQLNGDTNFRGILKKISQICSQLSVPVIVKEVGNGISSTMAKQLIDAGVAAIDIAGAGGTSWAKVEGYRAKDNKQHRLGQTFTDWGLPTAECIISIRECAPNIPLIASGGLKNGLDIAKVIALGANLAGLARLFLTAAVESELSVYELAEFLIAELEITLFCTGNIDLVSLQNSKCIKNILNELNES